VNVKLGSAQRHSAGADENNLPAIVHECGDACGQGRYEPLIKLLLSVADYGGADFHHDAAGAAQQRARVGFGFRVGWRHGHGIWVD
jgi:hypothetical protein